MVAAPVDCSRSAYALSARYQSLNPQKCYATTEDGQRVTPLAPEDAIAAAGIEPLARAIVDEEDGILDISFRVVITGKGAREI